MKTNQPQRIEKMRLSFIFLLVAVTLMGCNDPFVPGIAKTDISAYADVNDSPEKVSFIIPSGTICEVGGTAIGKVDAYAEVRCPMGRGWVLLGDRKNNFEPIP